MARVVGNLGHGFAGKGGTRLRAFETWMDVNGDKLIWELVEKPSKDAQPGTFTGTARVISGTGQFAGMKG